MNPLSSLLLMTAVLAAQAVSIHAATDLFEWRHDYVSGLTPNSRGVDVAMNDNGDLVSIAYTTSGSDEKWLVTRHDNITGAVVWQKTVGVTGYDCRPVAVAVNWSGVVYVTGYVGGPNGRDIRTIAYNRQGQDYWTHTFNGAANGNDEPKALKLDSDHEVIVTGSTAGAGTGTDVITLRLDRSNGSELWKKIYTTSLEDAPAAIGCDPYGSWVYVAGKVQVGSTLGTLILKFAQETGVYTVAILNDTSKDDEATDIVTDGLAAVYVARRIRNSASNCTAAVSRYDGANGAMWTQTYDAPGVNPSVTPRLLLAYRPQSTADAILCCESRMDAQREGVHVQRWKADGTSIWSADTVTLASPAGTFERFRAVTSTFDQQIVMAASNEPVGGASNAVVALRMSLEGEVLSRQSISGSYGSSVVWPVKVATNQLGQMSVVGTTSSVGLGLEDFLIARLSRLMLAKGDRVSHPSLGDNARLSLVEAPAIDGRDNLFARVSIRDGARSLRGLHGYGDLLVLQGDPVPGVAGAKFYSFGHPVTGGVGGVCFSATLSGVPSSQATVICNYLFNAPVVVLQTGKPVPGANGALLGSVISFTFCSYGPVALVRLTGPGVTAANSLALIGVDNSTTGQVILRTGEVLTVNGLSSAVKGIQIFTPSPRSTGHGRAVGTIQDRVAASVTLVDGRTVLVHHNLDTSTRTLQLFSGGSAVAVNASAQWKSFGQPSVGTWFDEQAVLASLKTGQGGVTSANDTAIVAPTTAGGAGAWMTVVREGGSAPGIAGTTIRSLQAPLTDRYNVAFMAQITGTGVTKANNTAIWYGPRATPQLLVRTGMFATDGTGADTSLTIGSIRQFVLATHHPVFLATLKGKGVTASNLSALYGLDAEGYTRELLRKGQRFGTARLLSYDLFKAQSRVAGSGRSFNDEGTLAIQVRLSDGRQGVLLRRVP